MANLVDYLGLISTAPATPAAGDMVRRSLAGGWETINPGSVGDLLRIDSSGMPGWTQSGIVTGVRSANLDLPSESKLNFKGGLIASDNGGAGQTDVDVGPAVLSDASQSGGSSDTVVHLSKYFALVGLIYTTKTAALQTAHDSLPANGGILLLPTGTHIIDNAQLDKPITLKGVAGATWLTPGDSGRVFTSYGSAFDSRSGTFVLRDVCIGDPAWPAGSVDRSYTTPFVDFIGWSQMIVIDRVYVRFTGTGTAFRFGSSGNIAIHNTYVYSWQYGMAFVFEKDGSTVFEADTISFKDVMVQGRYFAKFGTEAGTYTVSWHNTKIVVTDTSQVMIDHSLSADAAAGASTITLQTGQGASWAAGKTIYIAGDYATEGAGGRTGNSAEVNKVLSVSGDVLTLSKPLQFAHGTNGNTFNVQALGGGVALSIASNTGTFRGDLFHFEACAWAIIDYGSVGSSWMNCNYSVNRFIRLAGAVQQLTIGPTRTDGKASEGENYLLDLPAWNTAAASTDYYWLNGPWTGASQPSVLDSGTPYTMDLIHNGALFRNKTYDAWDIAAGRPRMSHHGATASTFIAHRYGYSTNPDQLDLAYGGNVTSQSDIAIGTAGKGLKVKEGANAKQGAVTLVAGTATVANTSVTATSRIHLTPQTLGTVTRPKGIGVTARTPGTSFTIASDDPTDTSVIAYEIFEPG